MMAILALLGGHPSLRDPRVILAFEPNALLERSDLSMPRKLTGPEAQTIHALFDTCSDEPGETVRSRLQAEFGLCTKDGYSNARRPKATFHSDRLPVLWQWSLDLPGLRCCYPLLPGPVTMSVGALNEVKPY